MKRVEGMYTPNTKFGGIEYITPFIPPPPTFENIKTLMHLFFRIER